MLRGAFTILRFLVGSHMQQENESEMCTLVESGCVGHVLSYR
jgi:hypothetical protein